MSASESRTTDALRVRILESLEAPVLESLAARLDDRITLEVGEASDGAPPADAEVLVSGVPDEAVLDSLSSLHTLVIPYAGLPARTRERMLARPHVAVHNLHENAPAVAEFAVALLLAAAKQLVPTDAKLRRGDWGDRYRPLGALGLAGRRAVVLGFGSIGRRVARALTGLGMDVIGVRRHASGSDDGVPVRSIDELDGLLANAAALVVTLPLTDATRGLVGARHLAALPSDAILVNVGRGPVVDEDALYEALKERRIGAAGIDVWYRYPKSRDETHDTLPSTQPFHELHNVVMSPHRASDLANGDDLWVDALAKTLNAIARGEDVPHRVDVEAGY